MRNLEQKCHECGCGGNLPERRVLYGNQVWYRYTCKECGECWESSTVTIGKPEDEIEIIV